MNSERLLPEILMYPASENVTPTITQWTTIRSQPSALPAPVWRKLRLANPLKTVQIQKSLLKSIKAEVNPLKLLLHGGKRIVQPLNFSVHQKDGVISLGNRLPDCRLDLFSTSV